MNNLFVSYTFTSLIANSDLYKLGIVTSQQNVSFGLTGIFSVYMDILGIFACHQYSSSHTILLFFYY